MTMRVQRSVLITGATGFLGRKVLTRLLGADPHLRVYALGRNTNALDADPRIVPIIGDLRADGLGLSSNDRAVMRRDVSAIIHLAADTTFSAPLERARAVNTRGTERVLELANECVSPVHVAYVSTAFVAGRRTGLIAEEAVEATSWVNAYEQSKHEAEALVREYASSWVILRSSTVVCDDSSGRVTQMNAVHRALRLYHEGLAAMMPGVAESTVDVVTAAYVAGAIVRLALLENAVGNTVHLCAGVGALGLDELLDVTYERWARDAEWRRRRIARPVVCDLATYALFERSVAQVGDASLQRLTRALSHFVPQLALPKVFDTTIADALLGSRAAAVRDFWLPMIDHLIASHSIRRAA
jgi:long-chain acyl-CoA synthetase